MSVCECNLVPIDINRIRNIKRENNVITFDDGINEYSFNVAKSVLYMRFNKLQVLQEIPITIRKNPTEELSVALGYATKNNSSAHSIGSDEILIETVILPLYSENRKSGKYVPPKNNLNMRFAGGRLRNKYEIGIPIPAEFRRFHPGFFRGRDIPFRLVLSDGTELTAKQCQADGKTLMSNPNSALGEWMIDRILKISPSEQITYKMLLKYGIDSIELRKIIDRKTNEIFYRLDFAPAGSYETYKKNGFKTD